MANPPLGTGRLEKGVASPGKGGHLAWLGRLSSTGYQRSRVCAPGTVYARHVWDFRLGLDYIYAGPEATAWQIAGLAKVLLAIGILAISFIVSRRRKALGAS
jgi:hypothetical protein